MMLQSESTQCSPHVVLLYQECDDGKSDQKGPLRSIQLMETDWCDNLKFARHRGRVISAHILETIQ